MRLTIDLPWFTFSRRLAVALVALLLLLLAIALPASGAPPQGVSGEAPEPFTISMRANAGTIPPVSCQEVPLPAGEVVVENVDGAFTGPVDVWLQIPATIITDFGSGPVLAQTFTRVHLEGVPQNLASNDGQVVQWDGLLVIGDGMPAEPNLLFRTADLPVELCAEDNVTNIGEGGQVIIAGHLPLQ